MIALSEGVFVGGQVSLEQIAQLKAQGIVSILNNRPDFEATGREWRTPPLWGIGLVKTVNKHTNFLHDGRARNVEEAILWHGGEAEDSKETFKAMSKPERDALLKFVNSL